MSTYRTSCRKSKYIHKIMLLVCLLFDKVFGFPLWLIGEHKKSAEPLLFLQTGSGKAFGLNKQQPLHHIAIVRGGTYSRPRKIYQIRLKGIRFKHFRVLSNISVQIYTLFLTHANMGRAVARTKVRIRKQTFPDVRSPCMSVWLLLQIKIAQVFRHL